MKCFTVSSYDTNTILPYITATPGFIVSGLNKGFVVNVGNDAGVKRLVPIAKTLLEFINPSYETQPSINIQNAMVCHNKKSQIFLDRVVLPPTAQGLQDTFAQIDGSSAIVKIEIHPTGKNFQITSDNWDTTPRDFAVLEYTLPPFLSTTSPLELVKSRTLINGLYVVTSGAAPNIDLMASTEQSEGIFVMPRNSYLRLVEDTLYHYGNGYFRWAYVEHYLYWSGTNLSVITPEEYAYRVSIDTEKLSFLF